MKGANLLQSNKVTLLLVGLLVLALLGGTYEIVSRMILSSNAIPAPTPSGVLFNQEANQVTPQTQQAQQTQKQMKQYKQSFTSYREFPGILAKEELKNKKAVLNTTKGVIEFEIFSDSPKAASNFIFLTKDEFYDGLTFHRVVPGFVIQGGDPVGNGSGGPGYKFEDEPVTRKYEQGIVAMANAGPNTNGSQFFIMLDDNSSLPPSYTIFGKVIKGQEVVNKIQVGDVMEKVTIEKYNAPIASPSATPSN